MHTIDWRILIILFIILAGINGFLVKVASSRLNPYTITFLAVTSTWIVVSAISFPKLNFESQSAVIVAVISGIIGGISVLVFYSALQQAPASLITPLGTLYAVVTVILSYFFLQEVQTIKHVFGIILGMVAIFLLTS